MVHRDFDDLDRAVEEGGVLHTSNRLTTVQSWSLQHRHDLLAECSEADIQEMEDATLSVLHALAGAQQPAPHMSCMPAVEVPCTSCRKGRRERCGCAEVPCSWL